jgi:trehalose-6-phosphate synthase
MTLERERVGRSDPEPPAPAGERTSARLVVVSNRRPLTLRRGAGGAWRAEPSSGGLITALEPVLKRTGGLWVAWPGEAEREDDDERRALLEHWERQGYAAVDLPHDVFRILPQREELLRGLLGADLIAFQTYGHLQHFRGALLRLLGVDSQMDRVDLPGRRARLGAFPIGIVPEAFVGLLEGDRSAAEALAELRQRYQDQRLLLADFPHWRGRVVLIQVAVPSRERVSSYRDLRHAVNGLVGEINGAFGTPEWTPVVYIRRPVARATLVALYASADVGWVTPLRDGMNLVARERREVDPGWKARVQPILEHFVDRSPGSFVEEKEYALVWHYRMSDPDFGEWLANELLATLDELLAATELRAVRGRKSVEVRMIWAQKGEVAVALQQAGAPPGFQLALGDDVTDEDVFARAGGAG